ncbi:hypothetical protein [Acrocarpospora macrocephala]|uniref:hypothetical protein n=1 Tax=Acrocarpospora macrocephala TaxID=150177 RepID=UPI001FE869AC|nr:hypothetical protein [Acrocarpospora macrocephala]
MRQMQEPTFLILTALAAGPQHGYGVIADVAEISGGRVVLRAGNPVRRPRPPARRRSDRVRP